MLAPPGPKDEGNWFLVALHSANEKALERATRKRARTPPRPLTEIERADLALRERDREADRDHHERFVLPKLKASQRTPLALCHERGWVDSVHCAAALELQKLHESSGFRARTSANYGGTVGGDGTGSGPTADDFLGAMSSVGMRSSGAVYAVVLDHQHPDPWAVSKGLAAEDMRELLHDGLERLVVHLRVGGGRGACPCAWCGRQRDRKEREA